jgi:cobalt-zinc-cadmium efflux system membrane fusion protein
MSTDQTTRSRPIRYIIVGLVIVAAGIVVTGVALYGPRGLSALGKDAEKQPITKSRPAVELVEDMHHTLYIPERVRKAMGIKDSVPAQAPTQGKPLVMPGSTALDPARVTRIRTRFNAVVNEIPKVVDGDRRMTSGETAFREIRPGDKVKKGDVLAVVWSIDVGSRKSDLADALVQLELDEQRLKDRELLFKKGSLPQDTLNQTRRDVITDRNAKGRAERTLRTWNIPEKEIKAVYDEAALASARHGKRDPEVERSWARSELIAPCDGTIVERNISSGEYVADNTVNLFTIAEPDRLLVIANPPEDQLRDLLALRRDGLLDEMRWTLHTVGAAPIEGPIEEIGYILDANQHTAVVKGYIDNPKDELHKGQYVLRAGQFVSATVNLPPPQHVVEVPLTALAEDGKQSFVFVQPDPAKQRYTMRRVKVTHRFEKTAFVSSRISKQEAKLTDQEKRQEFQTLEPLKPGDRYLPSGVLELRDALQDKESKAEKKS